MQIEFSYLFLSFLVGNKNCLVELVLKNFAIVLVATILIHCVKYQKVGKVMVFYAVIAIVLVTITVIIIVLVYDMVIVIVTGIAIIAVAFTQIVIFAAIIIVMLKRKNTCSQATLETLKKV